MGGIVGAITSKLQITKPDLLVIQGHEELLGASI